MKCETSTEKHFVACTKISIMKNDPRIKSCASKAEGEQMASVFKKA